MYSAIAVANAFIELGIKNNNPLTHLQIQKLVYITQGFNLAITDEPLFNQDIAAWPHGPVIPVLYKKLKKFGRSSVTDKITLRVDDREVEKSSFTYRLIETVYDKYKNFSGGQLSSMTHKVNTPWAIAWHRLKFSPLEHDVIKEYYKELLGNDY